MVFLSNYIIYCALFTGMIYFTLANGTYFVLLLAGLWDIHKLRKSGLRSGPPPRNLPPVSMVAPAYDIWRTPSCSSCLGLLRVDYPNCEVILVNDGSHDRTFDLLKDAYDLVPEDFDSNCRRFAARRSEATIARARIRSFASSTRSTWAAKRTP